VLVGGWGGGWGSGGVECPRGFWSAIACLELVLLSGCFPAGRDRQRAYPHLSPGLGWTGKAQKLKRSRPFRPGRVLGRSWQTCAEAGSHPVTNSVISHSCEGFRGTNPALSTAR